MASRRLLLSRQRSFAERAGLAVDATGYLRSVSENLRAPLSASALADFTARGAGEFHDGDRHRARMRAVHSSTTLAVNVFDHWNTTDPAPLAKALRLPAPVRRVVFEPHLPTAAGGNPANPDVAIELSSGGLVAVECKFSEWLLPQRQRRDVFDGRYFPAGTGIWHAAGLPGCQALAEDLQAGRDYFRYLQADQLLKHALGLRSAGRAHRVLIYLYFEWPGRIGLAHEAELQRFANRIRADVDFRSLTVQALLGCLGQSATPVAPDYLRYCQARYLQNSGDSQQD